jgi:hypothetical protein
MVPEFGVGYIINDTVSNRRPSRVGRLEHELRAVINESGDEPGARHPIDLYFFAPDTFHDSACFHQSLRNCICPDCCVFRTLLSHCQEEMGKLRHKRFNPERLRAGDSSQFSSRTGFPTGRLQPGLRVRTQPGRCKEGVFEVAGKVD